VKFQLHPKAICDSENIGDGTRIWAFTHILKGAVIGADCNICDHVFIENEVTVGDRTTVKSGVQLWDGLRLEDDVFVGSNVTFSNDKFPRSKNYQAQVSETIVRKGASIGANSTILPGIEIGRYAMIGAGTVVTADVPPFAIIQGNPGRIVGYVDVQKPDKVDENLIEVQAARAAHQPISVKGVTLKQLTTAVDLRGNLSVGEFSEALPFDPKRFFIVYDVPSRYVRGEHAHRTCHQFLVAVHGSITIVVDDGTDRAEIELDNPTIGLHIPPMVWATQYRYAKDSVLMVLASHSYDDSDYIRDYEEFLKLRNS